MDVTLLETVPAANVEGDVEEDRADDGDDSGAYTALRVLRKRGRKPKIPDVIRESDSSSSTAATPPKKGRRGRPPSCATPDKQVLIRLNLNLNMLLDSIACFPVFGCCETVGFGCRNGCW